ncbi:uncharacterized protein METZ01_LOCUS176862 [marine metagenome]|uniref:Uncharacterized protein n=1 Tax=marine metagenome TaxID=408172 RepID=A0A382CD03_9ZZZZ
MYESKVPVASRNLIVSFIVGEGKVTVIVLLDVSQKYPFPASAVKSPDLLSQADIIKGGALDKIAPAESK